MELPELAIVHAVQVVARQDEDVLGTAVQQLTQLLAYGIGGSLVPALVVLGLFGRQDVDETVGEHVEGVGLHDVPVQAGGQELGQDEDLLHP